MLKLLKSKNFSIGNFLVGQAGQWNDGWMVTKHSSRKQMHKMDLRTKFQLNQPKIA